MHRLKVLVNDMLWCFRWLVMGLSHSPFSAPVLKEGLYQLTGRGVWPWCWCLYIYKCIGRPHQSSRICSYDANRTPRLEANDCLCSVSVSRCFCRSCDSATSLLRLVRTIAVMNFFSINLVQGTWLQYIAIPYWNAIIKIQWQSHHRAHRCLYTPHWSVSLTFVQL